jgi:hypothetical protein
MTDTPEKPTLQDIADEDSASASGHTAPNFTLSDTPTQDGLENDDHGHDGHGDETSSEAPAQEEAKKSGGGNGFVGTLVIAFIIGGALAAGWPYIGPRVNPVIAQLRELTGFVPRPTQARLPSEASLSPAVQAPAPAPASKTEPSAIAANPAPHQMPVTMTPSAETLSAETKDVDAQDPSGNKALMDMMVRNASEPTPASKPASMPAPRYAPESNAESAPQSATALSAGTDMAAIVSRLDALEGQISTLGAMSGKDAQAALNATSQMTSQLTGTLSAVQASLADLSKRVKALESSPRVAPTSSAQALVLGVTQLRSRLASDGPFSDELTALERIAATDPVVANAVLRLKPYAEGGIPREATLTARYPAMAKAVLEARAASQAEKGWMGAVKEGLGSLVTVRRTDPSQISDEVERVVATAEAALARGKLSDAVQALRTLSGPAGEAAAPWLTDAGARVDAETALDELHSHALAALSAAGGA